jgi:hypothetical protein
MALISLRAVAGDQSRVYHSGTRLMVLGIPTSPVERIRLQVTVVVRYRGKTLYRFSL